MVYRTAHCPFYRLPWAPCQWKSWTFQRKRRLSPCLLSLCKSRIVYLERTARPRGERARGPLLGRTWPFLRLGLLCLKPFLPLEEFRRRLSRMSRMQPKKNTPLKLQLFKKCHGLYNQTYWTHDVYVSTNFDWDVNTWDVIFRHMALDLFQTQWSGMRDWLVLFWDHHKKSSLFQST